MHGYNAKGNVTVNVEPFSAPALSATTVPCIASVSFLHTYSPSPVVVFYFCDAEPVTNFSKRWLMSFLG